LGFWSSAQSKPAGSFAAGFEPVLEPEIIETLQQRLINEHMDHLFFA